MGDADLLAQMVRTKHGWGAADLETVPELRIRKARGRWPHGVHPSGRSHEPPGNSCPAQIIAYRVHSDGDKAYPALGLHHGRGGMMHDVRHYLALPYNISVAPDCGTLGEPLYIASVEELPGCESHGASVDEALTNLRNAMELYISSMLEDGLEPPGPARSVGGPSSESAFQPDR